MKLTSIPFCKEIPDNWQEIPNKYLFEYHSSLVGDNWRKYQLLSLTTSGVKEKDINAGGGKVPDSYDKYQTVEPGDIVFCLFDLDVSAVFSGLSHNYGMITSAYDVVRAHDSLLDQSYCDFWFQYVFSNRYYKMYSKNIRFTIGTDMFKSIKTPVPPIEVQKRIGAFLNKKTHEIDSLIDIHQRQIETLSDYKKAFITEIIKYGINDSCKRKDSNIQLIGDIGIDKNTSPLKFLLKEQMMYGAGETGLKEKKEGYLRYIRITDIDSEGNLKNDEDNLYLTWQSGNQYLLDDGDILFARSGGTVGKTFIYKKEYGDCAFAGYLIKAKCDLSKLLPEYLYFYTQSSIYELWKNQIFIQATIQNIGATKYQMLPVVICSISEQQNIVSYLKKKCTEIDNAILVIQEKITKLIDYKKSLIYEYITGKKEVA